MIDRMNWEMFRKDVREWLDKRAWCRDIASLSSGVTEEELEDVVNGGTPDTAVFVALCEAMHCYPKGYLIRK